jgi:RimJ/RimL family protein N-acetyltransferase
MEHEYHFSHIGEESRPAMIAKVDPENIASWKLGFQKGEVLDNACQWGSAGGTQKRDQIKWYLRSYV